MVENPFSIMNSIRMSFFLIHLSLSGKNEYEFGDISREIENRRRDWISGFLGEEVSAI